MTEENVGKRGKVWSEKGEGGSNVFKLSDGEEARL
jgi:hypothetical protein